MQLQTLCKITCSTTFILISCLPTYFQTQEHFNMYNFDKIGVGFQLNSLILHIQNSKISININTLYLSSRQKFSSSHLAKHIHHKKRCLKRKFLLNISLLLYSKFHLFVRNKESFCFNLFS